MKQKVTTRKDSRVGKNVRVLEKAMGKELPSSNQDDKDKGKAKVVDVKAAKDKGVKFIFN